MISFICRNTFFLFQFDIDYRGLRGRSFRPPRAAHPHHHHHHTVTSINQSIPPVKHELLLARPSPDPISGRISCRSTHAWHLTHPSNPATKISSINVLSNSIEHQGMWTSFLFFGGRYIHDCCRAWKWMMNDVILSKSFFFFGGRGSGSLTNLQFIIDSVKFDMSMKWNWNYARDKRVMDPVQSKMSGVTRKYDEQGMTNDELLGTGGGLIIPLTPTGGGEGGGSDFGQNSFGPIWLLNR